MDSYIFILIILIIILILMILLESIKILISRRRKSRLDKDWAEKLLKE